jgi:phosphoribosylpyrophosphate synthetase
MTEHTQEIHDQNDHPITTTSPSPGVMASNSIKLLTGNSHPALAKAVADQSVNPYSRFYRVPADHERCSLGIELTKIMVLQYSNQETSVTIGESVRDEDGEFRFR